MSRNITVLVAGAALMVCETAHGIEMFEQQDSTSHSVSAYHTLVFDNRVTSAGLDHSHSERSEETFGVTNSIAASGDQLFEVYAIHSEGPIFSAVVSMKTLPTEKFFTSEKEAEERATELQKNETRDNIQYSVRPAW